MNEHDEKRLRLALSILSGRSRRIGPHELMLLGIGDGYPAPRYQPDIDAVRSAAENIIFEFIKRALEPR